MAKFSLRPYQLEALKSIYDAWARNEHHLVVLPTGAGKTVLFCEVLERESVALAMAHRHELVAQMSLSLARNGVVHRVIGSSKTLKSIARLHAKVLGQVYLNPNSSVAVASVDTLIRRDDLKPWLKTVRAWVVDEAHHIIRDNKWGRAVDLMPNARGLGVTATPERADGQGLGANADGYFHSMHVGPTGRWLIDNGYLVDYKIFGVPSISKEVVDAIPLGSTGDYNANKMRATFSERRAEIVGDVVEHYKKHAPQRQGIVFSVDIPTAIATGEAFEAAGVPCAVLSAKTPDTERAEAINSYKSGHLKQLINVDLFGEGFDLPALVAVSMERPTASYGLYCQQFGRALRPVYAEGFDLQTKAGRLEAIAASSKPYAIIIDHVGNVPRHGLPDGPKEWTLNRREKATKSKPAEVPLKYCVECSQPYERKFPSCTWCGHYEPPTERTSPESVAGDLEELSQEVLQALRGSVAEFDLSYNERVDKYIAQGLPEMFARRNARIATEKQEGQVSLRPIIEQWAGYRLQRGQPRRVSYREFYFKFGLDVLSACTLNKDEAIRLTGKLLSDMI